jgi:hypothetical protein
MRRTSIVFGLGIAVVFFGIPASADPLYSFQTVIDPGDPAFTQLLGINDSSIIAGYFGDGTIVPNNGFTLALPNTFTPENFPGSAQTQVVGINAGGETVGFWIDGGGVNHGFTDVGNTFTSVDSTLTTTVTQLLGVNASGLAAGYYTDGFGNFQPFTWQSGTFTPVPVPGLVSAQATDVNNAGWIAGFNQTSPTTSEGFLDVGGTFTLLEFPGSVFTQALGLNNDGQVVGDYVDAGGAMHGFVYNVAGSSYASIDDPNGVGTTTINGINDLGQLVGFYVDANLNTDGFVATPVPEPRSLTLLSLIAGLLVITIQVRKLRA